MLITIALQPTESRTRTIFHNIAWDSSPNTTAFTNSTIKPVKEYLLQEHALQNISIASICTSTDLVWAIVKHWGLLPVWLFQEGVLHHHVTKFRHNTQQNRLFQGNIFSLLTSES